jgi:hypothetical protein
MRIFWVVGDHLGAGEGDAGPFAAQSGSGDRRSEGVWNGQALGLGAPGVDNGKAALPLTASSGPYPSPPARLFRNR